MQKSAPHATLQVITAERQQALDLLDADRTDLALGWFDGRPSHFSAELMMEENLFCVFRRDHPIVRRGSRFDIAAVLSYPHVVVSATGQRTAIFDELLKRHGLSRHALVAVTNFTAVPSLLAAIGGVVERHMGLAQPPLPLDMPQAEVGLRPGACCPQCGAAALVRSEGCDKCLECPYSKCG